MAVKDIAAGDEITTCYSMLNWQDKTGLVETGFACACGSKVCIGLVADYAEYPGKPAPEYTGPCEGFASEFLRVNPWVLKK